MLSLEVEVELTSVGSLYWQCRRNLISAVLAEDIEASYWTIIFHRSAEEQDHVGG